MSIIFRAHRAGVAIIRRGTTGEARYKMRFYAVYQIFHALCGENWCAVRELTRARSGYSTSGINLAVLLLGRLFRRIAVAHFCDESCAGNVGILKVRHSAYLLYGGVYRMITRQGGYPSISDSGG